MLFTTYILFSNRTPRTYVGYTKDLEIRLNYHNTGKVVATKYFKPWKVIYTETGLSEHKAKEREIYWKSGAGRKNIARILQGFPPRFKSGRGSPK